MKKMNIKTFKAISITVILAIAVSLLMTSGAYAQSVSISGGNEATVAGAGSSASVSKACADDVDPYVEKAKSYTQVGTGKHHEVDWGSISGGTPGVDYVEVNAGTEANPGIVIDVAVRGAGEAHADALISARAELNGGDPWVEVIKEVNTWVDAPGRARATAYAHAAGDAYAIADASGLYHGVAVVEASLDGDADASSAVYSKYGEVPMLVGHSGESSAGLSAYAEIGSVEEEVDMYSYANVEGTDRRTGVRADSSVSGTASAYGELIDPDIYDFSEASVTGEADSHASVRGVAEADSWTYARPWNYVESEWGFSVGLLEDPWVSLYMDAELIDDSLLQTGSSAEVFDSRSSARAGSYVEADMFSYGETEKPNVRLTSEAGLDGAAGSYVSVVKEGSADSIAGAYALNVVDGYVDLYAGPFAVYSELDMLDLTVLYSVSSVEGENRRTRVYTNDWVNADLYAYSSWTPSAPDVPTFANSETSGSASQSIRGKGEGSATSAAVAGSVAVTNLVDPITIEELVGAGIGTYVYATDGSRMYPVASLADVETSAWTEPSASAVLTGGSGKSWLKPWRNAADTTVSGEIYLNPPEDPAVGVYNWMVTGTYKDIDDPFDNEAYGYLGGLVVIMP